MSRRFSLSYFLLLLLGICRGFCLIKTKKNSCVALFEQEHDSFREERGNTDDDADDNDEDFLDVDTSTFKASQFLTFSLNGRSPPSQRKAIGLSRSSNATIHGCENCGTEYVQWVGRCSTCHRWNTLQSHSVPRRTADEIARDLERKPLNAQDEENFAFGLSPYNTLKINPTFEAEAGKESYNITSIDHSVMKNHHAIEGRAMTISGMKPVAVNALVVAGSGRRNAEGVDLTRLYRTLAILQKKYGIDFRQYDAYVECAVPLGKSADLAVAAAVLSSLSSIPIRSDSFLLGEIDLFGHIQPTDESYYLWGFSRIVCGDVAGAKEGQVGRVICRTIAEAMDHVLVKSLPSFYL